MRRINFTADMVSDVRRPGIRSMIDRMQAQGDLTPQLMVDNCLDLMGPLEVDTATRDELVSHAQTAGGLSWATSSDVASAEERISEMLQLIVSLRDYQYA